MKPMLTTFALGMSLTFGMPAWAETQPMDHSHGGAANHTAMPAMPAMSGMNATFSEGLVKKVDKDQGKITLKHGPLENLGMPGMTMVFRVQDAGMLDQVKPGDKVRFLADRANGSLIVTKLETGL
ncbi:copper-binding protein [Thiobacillus denitrificans]|uniref:copper-binding protein n=1 Tax=Thiobacillus denitrificans TaxID=36861 RepID=UPI00037AD469|nr:copper-binding protein [Thiobacillus denitrificans]